MAVEKRSRDIDQGWAWWVLFASYINLLLCSGLSFVAGMFQVVFLEEFDGSVALTAWVTSLFSSFMQLGGPVSSALANAVSCRCAVMVGGACLAIGLAFSSQANTLGVLFVFFGIVAGVGLGLTYTASVVIINYYFERRRTMVTGIALSSAGLGIILTPQISTFLFNNFSWRETLSLMSATAAQLCLLGAIMFPMHERKGSCCSPWYERFLKCLGLKYLANRFSYEKGKSPQGDQENQEILMNGNGAVHKSERNLGQNGIEKIRDGHLELPVSNGNCHADKNQFPVEVTPSTKPRDKDVLCVQSEMELPTISEKDPHTNGKVVTKSPSKRSLVKRLADVNNSTRSLGERSQRNVRRYRQPRYLLKQYYHPDLYKGGKSEFGSPTHRPSPAWFFMRSYPKSQSHFELDSSRHQHLNILGPAPFRSHYELRFLQATSPRREHHGSHSTVRSSHIIGNGSELRPAGSGQLYRHLQSPTHRNHLSASEVRGSRTYSFTGDSCEKISIPYNIPRRDSRCTDIRGGTGYTGAASNLQVSIVPYNQSLLSVVPTTKHVDLVIRHGASHASLGSRRLNGSISSRHQNGSINSPMTAEPLLMDDAFSRSGANHGSAMSVSHVHVGQDEHQKPLIKNVAFLILCCQLFIANCACGMFNVYLPSFAMSKGLTNQEMTNILSFNGLALLNGRMMVGALASATGLELLIYWGLHIMGGLFVILMPAVGSSYYSFCAIILGVGTFFGSVYSVLTSLTIKYVGLGDLATAFGVEMISAGLGYLLAPPLAGIVVDMTGSYDYDMYCAGGLLILSATLLMLLPIIEPEVTRTDLKNSWLAHGDLQDDIDLNVDIDDDQFASDDNCDDDHDDGDRIDNYGDADDVADINCSVVDVNETAGNLTECKDH